MDLNQDGNYHVMDFDEYQLHSTHSKSFDAVDTDLVEDSTDAEVTFPDPTNPDPIDPDIINPAVVDPNRVIDTDKQIDPDEDTESEVDPAVTDLDEPNRISVIQMQAFKYYLFELVA